MTGVACKFQTAYMPDELRIMWGRRLEEIRRRRGLSQMEVATRAGTDKGYYRRIERGQVGARGPSDDMRMRIAAALDVQVVDIWIYPAMTSQRGGRAEARGA